jgi:hypothetical protein
MAAKVASPDASVKIAARRGAQPVVLLIVNPPVVRLRG